MLFDELLFRVLPQLLYQLPLRLLLKGCEKRMRKSIVLAQRPPSKYQSQGKSLLKGHISFRDAENAVVDPYQFAEL